jgi:RNA polymerase-binding transcription factor DksA
MTDIHHFKEILVAEMSTLEEELATIAQPSEEVPATWVAIQTDTQIEADIHDQADLLDQYQENRALVEVLSPRYQQVVAAIERIENDTYGVCEVCGEDIEEERLEADPAASTCKAHLS